MSVDVNVLIIGGGPAGLTAGLYASRAGFRTLLLEKGKPGGQIGTTAQVDNYPGFDLISGTELADRMEDHARKFGTEIRKAEVRKTELTGPVKTAHLDDGELIRAQAIIVATGASPRPLGVPGEQEYRSMGVSYCATCDGPFFRDQDVIVVGGGDSALEEGLFLSEYVRHLTLVHRRNTFRAQKIIQDRFQSRDNVRVKLESVVERFEGNETGMTGAVIRNRTSGQEERIAAAGAFIYIGALPATDFLGGVLETTEAGFIVTDESMRTSIPGVFSVGDVRSGPLKQVSTAVGEGAIAAVAAERYLRAEMA